MSDKVAKLAALLRELPIDTTYEQGLLQAGLGGEKETCLIAGTQDADPFMLLPIMKQLFREGELPPFEVMAEYADEFCICAVNSKNEREKYMSIADFRGCCMGRLGEISQCILYMPHELLNKHSLRFAVMDGISMADMNTVGRGCGGCIIVAEADAGALSDEYVTLCTWLAEERCIGDKTAMVVNKREDYTNGDMLAIMAATLLGRAEIPVFTYDGCCGDDPESVLRDALGPVMGGAALADDGVLRNCCSRTEAKLNELIGDTQAEEARCEKNKEAYREALRSFTAMADMEMYSLNDLLEKSEVEAIRKEIQDMFASLKEALPGLIREAETNSGKGAREDIKQLIGDYIGDLANGFTECLLNQVAQELLLPRTMQRFEGLCRRFDTLMKNTRLEQENDISHGLAEFLKISNINVGTNHEETVKLLTEAVHGLVDLGVLALLSELEMLTPGIARFLEKQINKLFDKVEDLVDAGMVQRLKKKMAEHLDKQSELLCDQLDKTMLPRLYGYLGQEYTKLVDIYKKQLRDKEQAYEAQRQNAARSIAALKKKAAEVRAICGA